MRKWLAEMLFTPRNEFPEFPAALSFVLLLNPGGTRIVLERRAEPLRERLAALDRELAGEYGNLPRVTFLETEYPRTVTDAELRWATGVAADLRMGALTWSDVYFADLRSEQ